MVFAQNLTAPGESIFHELAGSLVMSEVAERDGKVMS